MSPLFSKHCTCMHSCPFQKVQDLFVHLYLCRYPYGLLVLFSTPSFNMLWVRYTLWIPLYPLSVLAEGMMSRPQLIGIASHCQLRTLTDHLPFYSASVTT